MKFLDCMPIFLAVSLTSFAQTSVQIKFASEGNGNSIKHFAIPLEDGSFLLGNTIKAQTNEEGIIDLKLDLINPGIIIFNDANLNTIEVYVEPNKLVRVNIDKRITFSGALERENTLLRSFNRKGVAHALGKTYLPHEVTTLIKSINAEEFQDSLDYFISRDQKKIDHDLFEGKKLSPRFIDYVQKDIRLYYYDIGVGALGHKLGDYLYKTDDREDSIIDSEWGKLLTKLVSEKLVSSELRISQWYFSYLYDYVFRYKYSFLKERAKTSIAFESPNSHMLHNYFVGRIPGIVNEYFNPSVRELFIPNYLAYHIQYGGVFYYSEEMLDYYKKFKTEFPNSEYTKYVDQKMDKVEKYLASGTRDGVYHPKMIDNYERINTFDELIDLFRGNVIFIDIWATWCGPCVEEFNHYEKLIDLESRRKDFKIIFYSRDKSTEKARWMKFIEKKKLSGYHILPNEKLEKDMRRLINWTEIPRYVIVDKDGKIVNAKAPQPSDSENLLAELARYLDK